jgi:hypothetical protein
MLRELDAELDEASKATGRSLVWTATDRELLTLIGDSIDRKVQLRQEYDASENVAERVKLSAEVRLLETRWPGCSSKSSSTCPLHLRGSPRMWYRHGPVVPRRQGGIPVPRDTGADVATLRVDGLYERIRSRELKLALSPDPRLLLGDLPAHERAVLETQKFSPTVLRQVQALMDRQPIRVPRWMLGGRTTCPQARGWAAYASGRYDWFTLTPDDVLTPA